MAALLLFLLTACSLPGMVRPTVKIGLVAPFEGRYRYVGYDAIYAVQLALLDANEAGGVAGYGVELMAYDDGADPVMAVEQANKLAIDPMVVAAIGHLREETTVAAGHVYTEAGIPLLAAGLLDTPYDPGEDGIYLLGPTADRVADALTERAVGLASGGAFVVLVPGGELEQVLHRIRPERLGSAFAVVSFETEEWDRELLDSDPAVVVCLLDAVPAGEAVEALRDAGWGGQLLGGPALAASDYFAVAGQSAVRTEYVTPWPFPADVLGGQEFAAAYRRVSGGSEPGPLALPAYEAAQVLLQALEQAAAGGQMTREGVRAALAETEVRVLERTAVDDGRQASGSELYWYRIGPAGHPMLLSQH